MFRVIIPTEHSQDKLILSTGVTVTKTKSVVVNDSQEILQLLRNKALARVDNSSQDSEIDLTETKKEIIELLAALKVPTEELKDLNNITNTEFVMKLLLIYLKHDVAFIGSMQSILKMP